MIDRIERVLLWGVAILVVLTVLCQDAKMGHSDQPRRYVPVGVVQDR